MFPYVFVRRFQQPPLHLHTIKHFSVRSIPIIASRKPSKPKLSATETFTPTACPELSRKMPASRATRRQQIDFVVHHQLRNFMRADFFQDFVGHRPSAVQNQDWTHQRRSSTSAIAVSSKVAENADTSLCGKSRTKPTVSVKITLASCDRKKPARSGIQSSEQLVFRQYVCFGQAVEQAGFFRHWYSRQWQRFSDGRSCDLRRGALFAGHRQAVFQCRDFCPIKRRSVSNWVSPGPFKPIPPFGFANVHNRVPAVRSNGSTEPAPPATYLPAIRRVWQKSPNQTHSVEDAALKLFFQITLLCRREFVIEHDQPGHHAA